MRLGTIISLGASAVLGVGALLVAKVWLPQASQNHDSKAAAAAQEQPNTVPVVVASSAIPYGTKVDAGHLVVARLPANAAPQGAFSSIAQVVGQTGGPPIALIPIAAREPVLPSKLSGAGAKPTVAAMVAEGMRAYTIGVNDVSSGGGHILPGDRVDVYVTVDLVTIAGAENQASGQGHKWMSMVVVQNIRVLGMDLNADPSSTNAVVAHTATLEVSPQDAEKLALSAQAGTMTLALRRTGQADITPAHLVGLKDVASGQSVGLGGVQAHVTRVHRRAPAKPAVVVTEHAITVVHGDARTSVVVPTEHRSGV